MLGCGWPTTRDTRELVAKAVNDLWILSDLSQRSRQGKGRCFMSSYEDGDECISHFAIP